MGWFEIDPYVAGGGGLRIAKPAGGYVRDAMKKGLVLEAEVLGNPFQYGFIGSSDTHTGAGSFDESNFFAKVVTPDSPQRYADLLPISDEDLAAPQLLDADESTFYVGPDGGRHLLASSLGLRRFWSGGSVGGAGLRESPSTMPFVVRRRLPHQARACACAFLPAMTSMPRC